MRGIQPFFSKLCCQLAFDLPQIVFVLQGQAVTHQLIYQFQGRFLQKELLPVKFNQSAVIPISQKLYDVFVDTV